MKNLYIILFLIFTPLSIWGQCTVEWQDDAAIWQDDTAMWTLDDTGECEKKVKPPLSIFPNPTTDYFEVRNWTNIEGYLFDLQGRLLRKVDVSTIVNISDLPCAMYIIRVDSEMKKIIKIN